MDFKTKSEMHIGLIDRMKHTTSKEVLTEERVRKIIPEFRKAISFYREYPDIYIDQITPPDSTFKLYFYQRLFLRAMMRHKYFYATCPRAYSKSFLAMGGNILRCIFYPGAKIFITAGGKEQGATIARDKIEEWLELCPILDKEIEKKEYRRDYTRLIFKNKSKLDIVAARESSRGGRRHAGTLEECILIDGQKLNEVILPLMNVSRRATCGEVDPNEVLSKSQTYVTTAGYKNTFAYQKLIQLLIWQIIRPDMAFVMGSSWRIPVLYKLQDKSFINDLKADGTFNEMSFDREYESHWTGSAEDSFFDADVFEKYRTMLYPEDKINLKIGKNTYYILTIDVGRLGDKTSILVIKNVPTANGSFVKQLVNIYDLEDEHFEKQSMIIKKIATAFDARKIVIDANGLGVGLIDYLIKPSYDDELSVEYPPYGVDYQNEDQENHYRKFETPDTKKKMLYLIKANANLNHEAHVNAVSQLTSGKIRFLIDHQLAKNRLLSTKKGQTMSQEERSNFLKPYVMTSNLKEEMTNLREKRDANNRISLERVNSRMPKDRFSAFEYGLLYLKREEDKLKQQVISITDFIMGTSGHKKKARSTKIYTRRSRRNE